MAFANGMMHIIIEEGLQNQKFIDERTENFDELKKTVASYTPERVAEICGIDPDQLKEAARLYATAGNSAILYCLGVTEHSSGTEGVMSLANLAMTCGMLGRPGTAASTRSADRTTCRGPATWARIPRSSRATRSSRIRRSWRNSKRPGA